MPDLALALARPALLALALGLMGPARALDMACVKAISAANLKMIDAPAFRSTKKFGNTSLDLIKAEGRLFMRMGAEAWAPASMTLKELRDAVQQAEALVQSCERGGSDTVDGVPTQVYRFTVKDPTLPNTTVRAQVWIGARDGLPYREESPAVKASTTYVNVVPPR